MWAPLLQCAKRFDGSTDREIRTLVLEGRDDTSAPGRMYFYPMLDKSVEGQGKAGAGQCAPRHRLRKIANRCRAGLGPGFEGGGNAGGPAPDGRRSSDDGAIGLDISKFSINGAATDDDAPHKNGHVTRIIRGSQPSTVRLAAKSAEDSDLTQMARINTKPKSKAGPFLFPGERS